MTTFFGGTNTSKDYEMLQGGKTPASKPISLIGHSFTNFNNNTIARVTAVTVKKVKGHIVEQQIVLRPTRQLNVTFQVQCGSEGEVYTPLLQAARDNIACPVDLYINRLCADKDQYSHFYAMLDVFLDPPTLPNELISINDTTNVVAWQTQATAPEMMLAYALGVFRVANYSGVPLYAVAAMTQDCVDCDTGAFLSFVAGGGAGDTDPAILRLTNDRYNTHTDLTHGVANGNVFKGIYTSGDVILAGFADDPALADAATGGVVISNDGGGSFAAGTGISLPAHDVNFFEGQYVAVGGAGGGQGMLWASDDGATWDSITSDALSATKALHSIAVDPDNANFYACGEDGLLVKGSKIGDSIVLAALTPPGSPGALFRVSVLGPDHVAVGGASNYYAESFDGCATWTQPQIPGSAAIYGLAGLSKVRAYVGTGAVMAERSILTNNDYKTQAPQLGVTISGNYMDMKTLEDEFNYFVAVTDAGEIVLIHPFYPGA